MAGNDFSVQATAIDGLLVVDRLLKGDERGYLSRVFSDDAFAAMGWSAPIVQINHTLTKAAGTVRGLHFQYPPHAEDKFVSCMAGAVFDVAIDLRCGSPTFLQWHGQLLSAENHLSLLIPKGFAHGFQTLTPNCEMMYLHSHRYVAEGEGALHPLDPRIGIAWPEQITMLSERDRAHQFIDEGYPGLYL